MNIERRLWQHPRLRIQRLLFDMLRTRWDEKLMEADHARAEEEARMTPNQFVLEYWKDYGAYMQRKEHLIEVTTTLYLAFVSALLLRDDSFWFDHRRGLFTIILWLLTAVLVWGYVARQFRLWSDAARISNSCQTLMARWLTQSPDPADLIPVNESSFPDVDVPKALADEIERRRARRRHLRRCQRLCDSPFEVVVYGLSAVWTTALLLRIWTAW